MDIVNNKYAFFWISFAYTGYCRKHYFVEKKMIIILKEQHVFEFLWSGGQLTCGHDTTASSSPGGQSPCVRGGLCKNNTTKDI